MSMMDSSARNAASGSADASNSAHMHSGIEDSSHVYDSVVGSEIVGSGTVSIKDFRLLYHSVMSTHVLRKHGSTGLTFCSHVVCCHKVLASDGGSESSAQLSNEVVALNSAPEVRRETDQLEAPILETGELLSEELLAKFSPNFEDNIREPTTVMQVRLWWILVGEVDCDAHAC